MNHSRRLFVAIMMASAACPLALAQPPEQTSEPYSDKAAAEKWMSEWMQSLGATAGALHVGKFYDRMWYLTKEISWTPNPGQQSYPKVVVPIGFVTDFASIPRVFWSLLPSDGTYTFPAIIHDFLYWQQQTTRKEADDIFWFAMEDFKVNAGILGTIYAGVRAGGQAAWNSNASLRASGRKRVLRKFPDDARIEWTIWEKTPGAVSP